VKGHYRSGFAAGTSSSAGQIPSEYVIIFLVVFRLQEKDTDVVVSVNYPFQGLQDVTTVQDPNAQDFLNWIEKHPGLSRAAQTFKDIIANFEIVKWDLFDGEEQDE